MDESRSQAFAIRLPLAVGVVALAVYAAWLAGAGPPGVGSFVTNGVYNVGLVCAALACLGRAAVVRRDRLAWASLGGGLAVWTAGDLYWTVALSDLDQVPYPSVADFLYLAAYPCLYAGIGLLVSARVRFEPSAWLDGAVGALASAAVGTAVLAPALVGLTEGDPAAVATNLAYPLADLLLISFLIGGVIVIGTPHGWDWLLIGAGLVAWTIADGAYLLQEATSSYEPGAFDALWLVGALAIGGAAAVRSAGAAPRARHQSLLFPSLFALVSVSLLVSDHFHRLPEVSVWLAAATLAAMVARLVLSFGENSRLVRTLHAESLTDALSGLGNRRALLAELDQAVERHDAEATLFAIFDLDGFKAYNDTFGHPAGDALLRRLGANLRQALPEGGCAYRLGGDEFCILVSAPAAGHRSILAAAGDALREEGEGFVVASSSGAVVLPDEATDASTALRLADRRMYAEKGRRASSAERQTRDVLVHLLREREPALGRQLTRVAQLALDLGRRVGIGGEELDVLARAAELHDIGKVGVPDRILEKRGALDEVERELVRAHPLIGERILGAAPAMAPVARLVRSSHERWDGKGYPDGLAGAEIPLGSQIIFVCDSYDAMTTDRSYRSAVAPAEAIAELRRCAGAQFDPELVELLAREVLPVLGESGLAGAIPAS